MIKKQLFTLLFLTIIFGTSAASFAQTKSSLAEAFMMADEQQLVEALLRAGIWTKDESKKDTKAYKLYSGFTSFQLTTQYELAKLVNGEPAIENSYYVVIKANGAELKQAMLFMTIYANQDELDKEGKRLAARLIYQSPDNKTFNPNLLPEERSAAEVAVSNKRLLKANDYVGGFVLLKRKRELDKIETKPKQ